MGFVVLVYCAILSLVICERLRCPHIESTSCLAPEVNRDLLSNDRQFTFIEQHLVHCTANTSQSAECQSFWSETNNSFVYKLNLHYSMLSARKNHSLFLMDKKLPTNSTHEDPRAFSLDIAVDTRCHHSWPYNPYHRIADCLAFVLPALFNFFQLQFLPNRPNFPYEKAKLALIVDESSEMLCEFLNKRTNFEGVALDLSPYDRCLLHDFQEMIRSRYYYQCIKVSIFSTSVYWYKYSNQVFVQAKEMIFLRAQQNPWSSGSGFMNEVHYRYFDYLKEYRRLMLEGFCKYCSLPPQFPGHNIVGAARKFSLSYTNKHNLIVVLLRSPELGRAFTQQKELLHAIRREVRIVNTRRVSRHAPSHLDHLGNGQRRLSRSLHPMYEVVPYFGTNESTCETISLFWHAKVIIGAHGAGIVNTVFSRANSLLIEITPDKLEPSLRGQPWRMNAPFAHYMGLSSSVLVVPHNNSAKTDGEIQKVYALGLQPGHISWVVNTMREYLLNESMISEPKPQQKEITVMV